MDAYARWRSVLIYVLIMIASTLFYALWKSSERHDEELRLANLPEIAVDAYFREGIIDKGFVATFVNRATETTIIRVNLNRPTSSQMRRLEMTLGPRETKEIGESEGWAFISGDTITIDQDNNHKSKRLQIP